jgi:K+-transporting ATPase KdpF subunit
MTGILAAAVDNWVALGISVCLLVFLTVALLFPERF